MNGPPLAEFSPVGDNSAERFLRIDCHTDHADFKKYAIIVWQSADGDSEAAAHRENASDGIGEA
jgi:hypothetical protein